jgi:hypothetical protein
MLKIINILNDENIRTTVTSTLTWKNKIVVIIIILKQ